MINSAQQVPMIPVTIMNRVDILEGAAIYRPDDYQLIYVPRVRYSGRLGRVSTHQLTFVMDRESLLLAGLDAYTVAASWHLVKALTVPSSKARGALRLDVKMDSEGIAPSPIGPPIHYTTNAERTVLLACFERANSVTYAEVGEGLVAGITSAGQLTEIWLANLKFQAASSAG
jgi:hypothetical protein